MTPCFSKHQRTKLACLAAVILLATASCSPQIADIPITLTPTALPLPTRTPTPTITPLPSPTATPTPIIEPALPPSQSLDPLAVSPPRTLDLALVEQANSGDFNLVDAHAVYAYYRAEVGPSMWASDAEFIEAMETYAASLEAQGIELYQASDTDGTTYSMLVEGTSILLNFDPSGALTFADPGNWTRDSEPVWIDAGGPVDLVVGPDNHAYIVRLDSEGNVVAYLNTLGATLDNINNQWITVTAGRPDMVWNGSEFISAGIPILEIVGPCATNPETINEGMNPSCDALLELPSPITQEEFDHWQNGEIGLGVIARENFDDGSLRGVVAVGEIVDIFTTTTNIEGRDGQVLHRLLIDIPHANGILRFNFLLIDGRPTYRIFSLDQFLLNAADLTAQGLDLTMEDHLSDLQQGTQTPLSYTVTELNADLISNIDIWRGHRIGIRLIAEAAIVDPELLSEDREIESGTSIVPTLLLDPTQPVTPDLRFYNHSIQAFWFSGNQINRLANP